MATQPKAVLDTNVIVSGFISFRGPPGKILEALKTGRFRLFTSQAINEEVLEVMNRPRLRDKYHLADHLFAVAFILWEIAELVTDLPVVKVVKDPDDNKFLEAALGGDADYLVTGDEKDLLSLREWKGVKIVTPARFLMILDED